jgi:putative phosphoesterase
MTKLGVISDTHLRSPDATLERIVKGYFADVDLIVHLGDYVDPSIIGYLREQKEFFGVAGNMDPPVIRDTLPFKRVLEIEKHRIGIIHGWGAPFGLEAKVQREFDGVQAILYGHTHKAVSHQKGGTIFFNPGSAGRSFSGRPSIGILSIKETIQGEIIPF